MVGWHLRLYGHEFEQSPGDGEGQGSLACYSPEGCRESDTTWQLNNNKEATGNLCISRCPSDRPEQIHQNIGGQDSVRHEDFFLRGTAREGLSLGSCSALCRALGTSLSSLSRPPEEFTTLKAPGRLGLATFHRR